MTTTYQDFKFTTTAAKKRTKWAWFLALGITFIGLGSIAIGNLVLATIATVYYVGILMTIAGVVQLFHAFSIRTLNGFFFWLLGCVLYLAAGVMTLMNPLLASFVLTLLLGLLAAASGLSRIWLSFHVKTRHGWGWIVASGVVTTLTGLVFLLGWPVNSLWLLGLVLAIDLIFQGCALVGLAAKLRTA